MQPTKATDAQIQADAQPYLRLIVPAYALLLFDHLYSEYLVLKLDIKDDKVIALLDSLYRVFRARPIRLRLFSQRKRSELGNGASRIFLDTPAQKMEFHSLYY
jgi:hypothetical protein